jgi:hypothetical protein
MRKTNGTSRICMKLSTTESGMSEQFYNLGTQKSDRKQFAMKRLIFVWQNMLCRCFLGKMENCDCHCKLAVAGV